MVVSNFANAVYEYSTGDQNDNAQLTNCCMHSRRIKILPRVFVTKKKMIEGLMTASISLLKFFLCFVCFGYGITESITRTACRSCGKISSILILLKIVSSRLC